MIRTAVESSNIKEIAWEEGNLFVTFKKKEKALQPERVWRYASVPIEKYNGMAEAESPGRYLNAEIIPFFEGVEVTHQLAGV